MDEVRKQVFLAALRALFLSGGGFVTAQGWFTDETWQQFVGAIVVLASAVWMEWAAKRREVVAMNAGVQVSNMTSGMTSPIPANEVTQVISDFKQEKRKEMDNEYL